MKATRADSNKDRRKRGPAHRKAYQPPRLVEYGDLSRLTGGAPTSGDDFMFGGSEGGT